MKKIIRIISQVERFVDYLSRIYGYNTILVKYKLAQKWVNDILEEVEHDSGLV